MLALRGLVADDPLRAVQALPGVATGDDFKAEFAIRGHGPEHLGFSIDGIDSRLLFHTVRGVRDTGSLTMVNSDILDSVSIIAGARPQRLHASLGAAVDFATRDGARDRLHVRGLLSATAASTVWEGPAGSRASWLVAVRQSYLDWLLRRIDPEIGGTFGFTDAQARLAWEPVARHSIVLSAFGGRSKLHEQDESPTLNSLDIGGSAAAAASVRWRFTPTDRIAVTQQVYGVTAQYKNLTPSGAVRENGSDSDLTWRGGLEWTHGQGRLEAGGHVQSLHALKQDRTLTTRGPVFTVNSVGSAATAGGWVHSTWRLVPSLVVSPGARVDRWSEAGAAAISPWLLVEWQMASATRWRGGVGVQQQGPTIDQARLAGTAADLRPERARSVDVGVEQSFGSTWRASAVVYDRRERDRLRLVGAEPLLRGSALVVPSSPHWENALSGRSRGLGLAIERRVADGLSGWIGYALEHTDVTDARRGETYDADFDQRHTFNAYSLYRWSGRTAVSARVRVGSNFPMPGYFRTSGLEHALAAQRNRVRLPTYARLDVRADRTFTKQRTRFTLFAEVINVFNRDNVGPGDPDISLSSGRVRGLFDALFPVLPAAGLLVEF